MEGNLKCGENRQSKSAETHTEKLADTRSEAEHSVRHFHTISSYASFHCYPFSREGEKIDIVEALTHTEKRTYTQ